MSAVRLRRLSAREAQAAGFDVAAALEAGQVELLRLPIDHVVPSPDNPRKHFDEAADQELAASIRSIGILQPLLVREFGGGLYELVAGERRLRAAKLAGLDQVPCVLFDRGGTTEAVIARIVENVQRSDPTPVEIADALATLVDLGLSQVEAGERIGLRPARVSQLLALRRLPDDVREFIAGGQLTAGHGEYLQRWVDQPDTCSGLAQRAVEGEWSVQQLRHYGASVDVASRAPQSIDEQDLERLESFDVETSVEEPLQSFDVETLEQDSDDEAAAKAALQCIADVVQPEVGPHSARSPAEPLGAAELAERRRQGREETVRRKLLEEETARRRDQALDILARKLGRASFGPREAVVLGRALCGVGQWQPPGLSVFTILRDTDFGLSKTQKHALLQRNFETGALDELGDMPAGDLAMVLVETVLRQDVLLRFHPDGSASYGSLAAWYVGDKLPERTPDDWQPEPKPAREAVPR